MHDYQLVAKGVVTCYAHPVAKSCNARLPYEVPIYFAPEDEGRIESAIDNIVVAEGWCTYVHPGGMRYGPQWYCPRHVQEILNVPQDADDESARDLKNHLRPDRRR
jgi:hypothetical protein